MEFSGANSKTKQTNSDKNNNTDTSENGRSGEKYGLRPRTAIKRLHHDSPLPEVSKRSSRSKSRPAPLSKYRRKTANARERHRMKAINTAFESLRRVLPDAVEVHPASSTMTKITTLRLAVDYIRALSDVLEDESDSSFTLQAAEDISRHNIHHSSLHTSLSSSLSGAPFNPQHLSSTATPFTVPLSLCHPSGLSTSSHLTLHYTDSSTHKTSSPQLTPLVSYGSNSSIMSISSSPSVSRGSLGSTSDLEDLLSDDSGLLEDNLDVFHDIPTIALQDPFEVLLGTGKEGLEFSPNF